MSQIAVIHQQRVLNKDFAVYGTFENPLFLAKDVANWIEHSDVSTMLRNIEEDEKLIQTLFASGQNRQAWFLTEDGLYEVLMQSRKPIAKQFKKQVKAILKEIRQHGAYVHAEEDDDEEIIMAKALLAAKRKLDRKERLIEQQQQVIEEQKPMVMFANAIVGSSSSILIRELAVLLKQNGIDIGQGRLFEYLRNNGYLVKRKGSDYNMPTQKSMNLGLFEIKETPILRSTGSTISKTPKVTAKGQQYFINHFLKKGDTA